MVRHEIEGSTDPLPRQAGGAKPPADSPGGSGGGGNGSPPRFHQRLGPDEFGESLRQGKRAVRRNIGFVMVLTCATNLLILAIPIYLFQISDRVLTSRSTDTLIMLTIVIVGAVVLQAVFDAVRRFILMRTAVEVAARLGAPVLSAAAHAALHSNGREYQTLGDLQQVRGFLVSGTLLSFLDVPFAPIPVSVADFLIERIEIGRDGVARFEGAAPARTQVTLAARGSGPLAHAAVDGDGRWHAELPLRDRQVRWQCRRRRGRRKRRQQRRAAAHQEARG